MSFLPFLKSRRSQEDFAEEIAAHLALEADDLKAEGCDESEASRRARVAFNNPTLAEERFRLRNRIEWLDNVGRDLRFGVRQLRRSPGFAATAILTLALGLGANTAVFSLINGLLLRPLPVPRGEELAVLSIHRSDGRSLNYGFCAPLLRSLERHHDAFTDVAAYTVRRLPIRGSSGKVEVSGSLVSGQFFSALETQPILGRTLTPQDDVKGSPRGYAVVIGENFWRDWFNRSPSVIGSKLVIADTPFTVVGVMPRSFIGANPLERPSFFLPLWAEPVVDAPYDNIAGGYHTWWLNMIGRRRSSVSLEKANASLEAISNAVLDESTDADWVKDAKADHLQFIAEPGSKGFSYLRTMFRKPLYIVFALCGAMLLLACLNLASLLMARSAARERELATRLAIGASRRRLIQQLLIESLLISSLGTLTGVAVAPVISHFLASLLLSQNQYGSIETALDGRVLLFISLTTVVASVLIGLLPALRATSTDLNQQIKNGANGSSGSHGRSAGEHRRLLPRLLMGSEVALALVLVFGAGLLATSLLRLYKTGLGFEPKGLALLDMEMTKQPLDGDALLRWYESFGDALKVRPGVRGVAFQSVTPLGGSTIMSQYRSPSKSEPQQLHLNEVSPDYFRTMGIPVIAGREFRWTDTKASGSKIILNESAAKLLFSGQNAVGQSVTDFDKAGSEVIAVVGDVKYSSIREAAPPEGYMAMTQTTQMKQSFTTVIRFDELGNGSAKRLAIAARTLAMQMAPEIPAPVMTSMSATLDNSIVAERMMAMLSVFFAACALLVTAIGLYGTLAYATARRTSEIGIRMALGARRLQVVLLVFRENVWSAAGGSLAGLGVALVAARALSSFLYGTSARDPWVLVGSVGALVLIASLASLLPAVRAAGIDPMQALRNE